MRAATTSGYGRRSSTIRCSSRRACDFAATSIAVRSPDRWTETERRGRRPPSSRQMDRAQMREDLFGGVRLVQGIEVDARGAAAQELLALRRRPVDADLLGVLAVLSGRLQGGCERR